MGRAAVAPSTRSTSSTRASTRRSGRAPRRGDLDHVDYRAAHPRYHAAWGFTSLNERIVRPSFPESLSVFGLRERLLSIFSLSHFIAYLSSHSLFFFRLDFQAASARRFSFT